MVIIEWEAVRDTGPLSKCTFCKWIKSMINTPSAVEALQPLHMQACKHTNPAHKYTHIHFPTLSTLKRDMPMSPICYID